MSEPDYEAMADETRRIAFPAIEFEIMPIQPGKPGIEDFDMVYDAGQWVRFKDAEGFGHHYSIPIAIVGKVTGCTYPDHWDIAGQCKDENDGLDLKKWHFIVVEAEQ